MDLLGEGYGGIVVGHLTRSSGVGRGQSDAVVDVPAVSAVVSSYPTYKQWDPRRMRCDARQG